MGQKHGKHINARGCSPPSHLYVQLRMLFANAAKWIAPRSSDSYEWEHKSDDGILIFFRLREGSPRKVAQRYGYSFIRKHKNRIPHAAYAYRNVDFNRYTLQPLRVPRFIIFWSNKDRDSTGTQDFSQVKN